MRLAFISSSYPPYVSGVAINAFSVTSGMAKRGHDVGVFVPKYPGAGSLSAQENLSYHYLPSIENPMKKSHRLFNPFSSSLFSQLSMFKPEIIHVQEPNFFLFKLVRKYAEQNKVPIVCAHHFPPEFVTNQLPRFLRNKFVKQLIIKSVVGLYNQADMVITPTRSMERLLANSGLRVPLTVISNGVEVDRFGFRNQDDLSSRKNVLLYFGRVDFDKNIDILIRAVGLVRSKCEVWVAGGGKAIEYLKSMAIKLGLNEKIKFMGYVPEERKVEVYRQAKIFVMPSTAEAQSIVSLEAAASGLPLILADSEALPELIDANHKNGVLFKPNDYRDLADKIDSLMSEPRLLSEMGKNSFRFAKTHELNKAMDAYEETYLKCLRS